MDKHLLQKFTVNQEEKYFHWLEIKANITDKTEPFI